MNKEIKFRGKPALDEERIEELKQYMNGYYDGKFVYGNLIKDNWIVGDVVDSEEEWIALEYWIPVIPETVGQFTGLKDLNNKESFEDDLIQNSRDKEIYKIFWHKYRGQWMCSSKNRTRKLSDVINDAFIIGNIHDNPELLEVIQNN